MNINVRFIKNFLATNKTVENFGNQQEKRGKRKNRPDVKIIKWETHFRNVLNHGSSIDGIEIKYGNRFRTWKRHRKLSK